MKYGELNLGQIEAIVNKLGGMEGVKRLLAGGLTVKPAERTLAVWKTIKLGTGTKSGKDFVRAIEKTGGRVSDWAKDMLSKPAFTMAKNEVEIDLVKVTVDELGFPGGATREKIYARAKELGLELCPAEVGPQLRLQYADQPMGEWLPVAMEPISGSLGNLIVFHVKRHADGLWLLGYNGHADSFWRGDRQWLFVRPRK